MNTRREFFKKAGTLALVPLIATPTIYEVEQILSEAKPESFRMPHSVRDHEAILVTRQGDSVYTARGYVTSLSIKNYTNMIDISSGWYETERAQIAGRRSVEVDLTFHVAGEMIESIMTL